MILECLILGICILITYIIERHYWFQSAWKACDNGEWMYWFALRVRLDYELLNKVSDIYDRCLRHDPYMTPYENQRMFANICRTHLTRAVLNRVRFPMIMKVIDYIKLKQSNE